MISIVFPAYNEQANVVTLHQRLVQALSETGEAFEIIAVNDGSTDATLERLLGLSPIKVITFAFRAGQTAALDAGIHAASGDIIVTIDADLQNDPADIPRMLKKLNEGWDAVVGWRVGRRDSFGRKLFSSAANYVTRLLLGLKLHDYACALKMFKRQFIANVHLYGEMHVFLAGILHYQGARITELAVSHREREAGLSKHTFFKGIKDLADLFTVKFLFSTSRPLLIFGAGAVVSWLLAAAAVITAVALKLAELRNFAQTPLPVMASLFIILGFLLVMGGFLAELILRAYYEGKRTTPYTICDVRENRKL